MDPDPQFRIFEEELDKNPEFENLIPILDLRFGSQYLTQDP
jgi:hypothetical protein